jgi:photosystem II stability/assembly factor-like uncharacterized protein
MDANLLLGSRQGAWTAYLAGNVWQAVTRDLAAHRVNAVTFLGDVGLAGTTDRIFRTEDLGQSWQPASEGLSDLHVRWLDHHPGVPGLAVAGTEPAAIFVSGDSGVTWRERTEVAELRDEHGWYLPYSPGAGCVRGFALHGRRGYAAVEVGGLLRSDDAGDTWRLAGGSTGDPRTVPESHLHPDVHSVKVHPSSPDLVYAPTGGGFYRSVDGGKTWVQLYDCYCRAVWVDPADPDHIVLGPADWVNRNGRIEESVDGGRSWTSASNHLQVPWPNHMVERFVQADSELLAILSNGHLLSASLTSLAWQRILPDVEGILAVVPVRA